MPKATDLHKVLEQWSQTPRYMKPLRWVGKREASHYMSMRQNQNKKKSSEAEQWMYYKLIDTGLKWTRQAMWGWRLFDFWNAFKGVAIEVDGPEHRETYDLYRDEYNFRRSAIVVIRVRNFNEEDARIALDFVAQAEEWKQRRWALHVKSRNLLNNQPLLFP